ncbi:MAG TPA: acyl-CoA dehydrogenase family protein [Acidimicrobiales bacterium]|nr:acyl-CoA dehydrogenase family protein [Acidimicrobiales bacterium]
MSDEELVLERCEQLLAVHDPATTDPKVFLGAQYDAGLAWVHFPEGHGGLGLSPKLQRTVSERLAVAHAPLPYARNPIGYGMGAPTVVTHGSDAQRARYLRPLFTGEEIWCQLFSEPGAGSDVASLATTAVRDGDEWVVNGQKVWTTLAHLARWGMLIARTDPDAPKHKGMTYFVIDMHAPGVEVRPLRQMTGEAEFNEVFMTDVRIPDAERLGDVGEGWRVSLTTLMNERVSIGGAIPPREGGVIRMALETWRTGAGDRATTVQRDRLMQLWAQAEVLRLTNIRASQLRSRGTPGPEGSVGKILSAEHNKAVTSFVVDLMGAEGMLYTSYEMVRPTATMHWDCQQKAFLRMRANSIEGGTTEVMKNILGERVLGLPGDVRTDKDLPWREVPRS